MKTPAPALSLFRKPRRGFTLVELLTVIAIIGVLAAIIIPVVSNMRTSAKRSQGLSNLRQIVVASLAYTQENRGSWFASDNVNGVFYTEVISRYMENKNNNERSAMFTDPLMPNVGNIHFAVVGIYFKDVMWDDQMKAFNNIGNVRSPSRTVFWADNWATAGNWAMPYISNSGTAGIWGFPGVSEATGNSLPSETYGATQGDVDLQRDSGQAKLGFFDGHVAIVKREQMFHRIFDPRY